MSRKGRRACETLGFRAGCHPSPAQTESSNWQQQLIFLICYNKGKRGICSVDIGTRKENMVTLRWPTFSRFCWRGWAWGGGALLLWRLAVAPGFSVWWDKGAGSYQSSVAVFSSNQKPSFPSQANLEKTCPTCWQCESPAFCGQQKQALATCQGGHQWVHLWSHRDKQNNWESAYTEGERVYTLSAWRPGDLSTQVHSRLCDSAQQIPWCSFPKDGT